MSEHQDWSQYAPIMGRQVATPLPCPSWCALPDGHPFETVGVGGNPLSLVGASRPTPMPGLFRVHRRRFGQRETHIAVETYERTADATGPSDLGANPSATLVRVQLPDSHGYVSAAGARRLAELLNEAADVAESGVHP